MFWLAQNSLTQTEYNFYSFGQLEHLKKTSSTDTYSNFICSFYVKDKILYEGHLIEGENNA
jgi:hypothetical protein